MNIHISTIVGTTLRPKSTTWRVWSKNDDGSVTIMPTEAVNSFDLNYSNGFVNSVDIIEAVSDIYANSSLGVTSSDIRSLKIEDLEAVSSNLTTKRYNCTTSSLKYGETNEVHGDGGYTSGEFYLEEDGKTINKEGIVATSDNLVILTQTYYEASNPTWNSLNNSNYTTDTYGTLLGSSWSWLASPCVDLGSTWAEFFVHFANSGEVNAYSLYESGGGGSSSSSCGVRPLVTLPSNLQATGSGTTTSPWVLSK